MGLGASAWPLPAGGRRTRRRLHDQLPAGTDLGELRDRLARFAEAGFDDAVVRILPGGPAPAGVRRLLDKSARRLGESVSR